MQIIEGEGFELRAEKKKVKVKVLMVDSDLALLVLRWLDVREAGAREDADEPPH